MCRARRLLGVVRLHHANRVAMHPVATLQGRRCKVLSIIGKTINTPTKTLTTKLTSEPGPGAAPVPPEAKIKSTAPQGLRRDPVPPAAGQGRDEVPATHGVAMG